MDVRRLSDNAVHLNLFSPIMDILFQQYKFSIHSEFYNDHIKLLSIYMRCKNVEIITLYNYLFCPAQRKSLLKCLLNINSGDLCALLIVNLYSLQEDG